MKTTDEFELCEKTRNEILNSKTTSPLKAIHNYCIMCMGYHKSYVKNCTSKDCPLFMMRTGVNKTKDKREYTEEQKEAMRDRMSKARESKS